MKAFKITGNFRMGRVSSPFSKEVAAKDKNDAQEIIFSELGSKHKVKRFDIKIDKVNELKHDDITDSIVKFKTGE